MGEQLDPTALREGEPETYVQDREKAHAMATASDYMETKAVHHLEDAAEYVANLGKVVTDREMSKELEKARGFRKHGLKLAVNSRHPKGANDEKRMDAAEVSTNNYIFSRKDADSQAEEAARDYERVSNR